MTEPLLNCDEPYWQQLGDAVIGLLPVVDRVVELIGALGATGREVGHVGVLSLPFTCLVSSFGNGPGAFDGLSDVVAGRGSPVFRAEWPAGSGLAGFGALAGWVGGCRTASDLRLSRGVSGAVAEEFVEVVHGDE